MTTEFAVKRTGKSFDAVITSAGAEVAKVVREKGGKFELEASAEEKWELDPKVEGEATPFSMTVTSSDALTPVLVVVRGVFLYENRFYMFMGVPEDVEPKDHLLGGRHVVRLTKFPFASLEEVDRETWGRLRNLRGVSVAEISGLGIDKHVVRVSDELLAIGLLLAAVSYLLYATG